MSCLLECSADCETCFSRMFFWDQHPAWDLLPGQEVVSDRVVLLPSPLKIWAVSLLLSRVSYKKGKDLITRKGSGRYESPAMLKDIY